MIFTVGVYSIKLCKMCKPLSEPILRIYEKRNKFCQGIPMHSTFAIASQSIPFHVHCYLSGRINKTNTTVTRADINGEYSYCILTSKSDNDYK